MEWDKIEQILGIAMATVALDGGKQYFDWRKKQKEEAEKPKRKSENARVKMEIYNKLIEIRKEADCNRVDLYEFSNGKTTHGEISLDFIYCTLESVDNKSAGMIDRFQGIAIATMLKTITEINESPKGWIRFDDNSHDDLANKRRRYWGIMSSYNFKITEDIWDGMIGLHWMNEYAILTEENIQEITRLIEDIRNLMAKLIKKESMNIWARLRWALTFWVVLMVVENHKVITSNYQKSLSKPTIEAMINRDLYKYHEKNISDGK